MLDGEQVRRRVVLSCCVYCQKGGVLILSNRGVVNSVGNNMTFKTADDDEYFAIL